MLLNAARIDRLPVCSTAEWHNVMISAFTKEMALYFDWDIIIVDKPLNSAICGVPLIDIVGPFAFSASTASPPYQVFTVTAAEDRWPVFPRLMARNIHANLATPMTNMIVGTIINHALTSIIS